ncbi:HlyD family type I secretion periplasmic adaptor subunit [Marinobacter oulmenensis]|uniref:Membrane fusion protein (MFP) family protein n=1 Tax=Marinobacter oulmenensis TaxID=643747 RepID=A0A840U7E6_9GAMM|nr:HlyD family type I secretion periplasmic adaptor subunit [Marinobacter oulmenensis]MBB5320133.1 hemolysin D [Marinobacter oulmenensis]
MNGQERAKRKKTSVLSESDIYEFMPAAIEIEKTPASPIGRTVLYAIMLLFALAILWAIFGKIDIVAVAQGKVVPGERVKVIQPLETAVIERIHVEEGQTVKAGDPLITLNTSVTEADVRRFRREWQGAALKRIRLTALANWFASSSDRALTLESDDPSLAPFLEEHRELLSQEVAELQANLRNIQQESDRLAAEKKMVQAEAMKNRRLLEVLNERVAAYNELQQNGTGSRMDYLEVKQEQIEVEQNVSVQLARIDQLKASIQANASKREMTISERYKLTLQELQELTVQEVALREELLKAEQRSRNYLLKAPLNGKVQELAVTTIGGVVTPAQEIMKIVPEESTVEVEARFLNKDIGFIHPGQPAEIKVDTFNFTKYGVVDAELSDISGDAIQDEQLGLVYKARLVPSDSALQVGERLVSLAPGMTVTAEVKTGQRRVIEFFLSPLLRYQEDSLRER